MLSIPIEHFDLNSIEVDSGERLLGKGEPTVGNVGDGGSK